VQLEPPGGGAGGGRFARNVMHFARALRAAGLPFVVVTGYGPETPLAPALRDAPRLGKPCDGAEVGRAIEQAISPRG